MIHSRRQLILVTAAIILLLLIPVGVGAESSDPFAGVSPSSAAAPGDGVNDYNGNWGVSEPRGTTAVQDTPEPVLIFSENLSEWRMTSGFIYLTDTCEDGLPQTTAYVRRRPVNSKDDPDLLESVNGKPQCRTFRHAAADESGIYYYNRNLGRIEAIYSDTPDDPPTSLATIGDWTSIGFGDGISALKLDGSYVYWIEAEYGGEGDPADVRIKRVSKSGGTPSTRYSYTSLAAGQVSFNGLGVTSSHIWWIDGDGLNRIPSCTLIQCAPGPVVKTTEFQITISAVEGYIEISGSNVFWWNRKADRERIRRTSCSFFSGTCSTSSVHLPVSGITVLGLAANGEDAFWTEDVPLVGNRLRRIGLSGGIAETLAENIRRVAPYLDVDGVYFQTGARTISRLPFDAAAISRELGITGWEVTQGIQRPMNDVPLVAGKTTYVRLYPTLDGTDVSAVPAELHGSRDGQPLPGSPIYPINGTIPIDAGLSLADRGELDSGWLFRLPNSWTRTGDELIPQEDTTISLRGVIDPYGAYVDTDDPGNNEITGDFLFTAKAPTCMIMRPVITDAPYEATYGINVGQVVELTESVLPTTRLITFPKLDPLQKEECGDDDPSCSTAYDLDADDSDLLTEMVELDSWADFPAICTDNNARTLYAGIVHKDATWDWDGLARMGTDVFLTKVPKYGESITRLNGLAMVMVHEIGHNYNRLHIQCPMPPQDPNDEDNSPANPDPNYPYPTNRLDFNLPLASTNLHFGFDPLFQDPISPITTRDYMTYCGPDWYSDYTWRGIFNNTTDPFSPSLPFQNVTAEGDLVRVAGIIDAENNLGTLNYAWTIPSEMASDSQRQRWSVDLAPAWENRTADAGYHLQLIGTDGQILADKVVELTAVEDGHEDAPMPFELTLTAPAGTVARLQLMADETVLAAFSPGTAQPVVSIDQPTGGASLEGEITVGWTASDADGDPLLYNILYSPNNGDEWYPLLVNYGGTGEDNETITLDLSAEAGSDGTSALVRVITSDGYNTGLATSQPFSVAKRAPFVAITSPALDQTFSAEENIPLNGFAGDPEDGLIADDQFAWSTGQTGQTADLSGIAPGSHSLQLTVIDSDGQEATSSMPFTVAPLAVPETAESFTLDGRCDDAGYQTAPQLLLSPYDNGPRASAHIIHTSSRLWLCLTNLQDSGGYAGLLVDEDNSGEANVQSGDFGYFVKKDGTRFVTQGNGSDFENASAGNLSARIFDHGTVWSAELEISKSAFGDWRKRLALAIGHLEQTGDVATTWPRSAEMLSPESWGQTNLGLVAAFTAVAPESAVLGTGDIDLTVTGANFTTDNLVLWNGTALSTTQVDASTLTAVVPASLVTTAGTYEVSVGVQGVTDLTTAAHPFTVNNPQPVITSLNPNTAKMGASGMLVTINGTGFVDGASVVWDGEARPTTFVGPTQLTISVATAELTNAYTVPVVVVNPEPSVGPSNTVKFVISDGLEHLLLPLIER
jgi:hypothetical protein